MTEFLWFLVGLLIGGIVTTLILCWPAIPTIAKELELSQSTVRRALQDLRKAGLLETEQRYRKHGGKSSLLYTLKR